MNISELAKKLDGREYGSEITNEEAAEAKEAGLVVVFGYSDDNIEFRGAIDDEFGCYDGGCALIDSTGLLEPCEDRCKYYKAAAAAAKIIEAKWDSDGYSWYIASPDLEVYGVFDITEDGEKYCRGIVFEIKKVEAQP